MTTDFGPVNTVKEDTPTPPPKKPGSGSRTALTKSLTRMYGSIGVMLYPVDDICAKAILENSETMAESLEQLAKENERVRKVLEKMMEGTAWTSVIAAHMPVIASIATHHGARLFHREEKDEDEESEENVIDFERFNPNGDGSP